MNTFCFSPQRPKFTSITAKSPVLSGAFFGWTAFSPLNPTYLIRVRFFILAFAVSLVFTIQFGCDSDIGPCGPDSFWHQNGLVGLIISITYITHKPTICININYLSRPIFTLFSQRFTFGCDFLGDFR